ncbi:MMS19 nucleotide excision repair protein -like, partial [Brachionus plicatilis]
MLPILLFSLSNSVDMEEKLCLSSLKSFEMLLNDCAKNDDSSFIPYLQDILEKLIRMTKVQKSLEIRLLALNCLNIVALKLPPNQIIKYQKFVCKELEKCLTDKKRLCRQLAVEARNRWFLLTTKNS